VLRADLVPDGNETLGVVVSRIEMTRRPLGSRRSPNLRAGTVIRLLAGAAALGA
jgi:hypothetical protein